METTNLTSYQKDLINGLIAEFKKINPEPTNGKGRFGFKTIGECLSEEKRFKETISKHNLSMMELFVTQLNNDIKAFDEEFGDVLTIELGYSYPDTPNRKHSTLEYMLEETKKNLLSGDNSNEFSLFFVSKTRKYTYDSRFDFFGKVYSKIYVSFKRQLVSVKLANGEEVRAHKIVGLQYNTRDWLGREKFNCSASTLDELIQNHSEVQQTLVKLVK